jgi:diadenosine tetraphosphate (Ap4A) HIT family hydrolase
MTASACVLCDRAAGLDAADPGWLLRTDCWGVSMHPATPVPGWVAVQTMRHTEGLADVNRSEAAELGPLLSAVCEAVTRVTGSPRVYTYSLGEGCPHTHLLVGPPSAGLRGGAFIAALLGRDPALADQATADRTAIELKGDLSSRYLHMKGDIT